METFCIKGFEMHKKLWRLVKNKAIDATKANQNSKIEEILLTAIQTNGIIIVIKI